MVESTNEAAAWGTADLKRREFVIGAFWINDLIKKLEKTLCPFCRKFCREVRWDAQHFNWVLTFECGTMLVRTGDKRPRVKVVAKKCNRKQREGE